MPIKGSTAEKDDPPSTAEKGSPNLEKAAVSAPDVADRRQSADVDEWGLPETRVGCADSLTEDQPEAQGFRYGAAQANPPQHLNPARASSSSVQKPSDGTRETTQSSDATPTNYTSISVAQKPGIDPSLHSERSPHSFDTTKAEPLALGGAPPQTNVTAFVTAARISGWSHQVLAPHKAEPDGHIDEDEWQDMPAFAPFDLYNDDGKLIAKEAQSDDEANVYEGLGGAGKGYTRVQVDEDARSATSMDDNTSYLFKHKGTDLIDEDEELRDPMAQMQTTKDLLTETQRIAYVGVTRLAMVKMAKDLEAVEVTKKIKKEFRVAIESLKMWSQQMMLRLYAHMEISSSGNYALLGSWKKLLTGNRTDHDRATSRAWGSTRGFNTSSNAKFSRQQSHGRRLGGDG